MEKNDIFITFITILMIITIIVINLYINNLTSNITYLREEDLKEVERYLNEGENNGFVNQLYDEPSKINFRKALEHNFTLGEHLDKFSQIKGIAVTLYYNPDNVLKYSREQLKEFYLKKTGEKILDNEIGINLNYSADEDAYWNYPYNSMSLIVKCKEGYKEKKNLYHIKYEDRVFYQNKYELVLKKLENRFVFVSNKKIE